MSIKKRIIIKNTNITGKKPDKDDLLVGELAINLKDRTIYSKDEFGNIIVMLGTDDGGNAIEQDDFLETYNNSKNT